MTQRDQIVDIVKALRNQMSEGSGKAATPVRKLLRQAEATVEALEKQAAELAFESPEMKEKLNRLCEVKSVGLLSALCLLAYLPELGSLNRQTAAALAGLAPYNRDSGQFKGERHIKGGRWQIRRHVYMCALVAARWNPILSAFYKHLRQEGKAPKVALVAVARKLLVYLNGLLKKPALKAA